MSRSKDCPKCGADISDSYEGADPDVGINAGWYCDVCDEGFGDEDGPEPHDDDVALFGTTGRVHLIEHYQCPKCRVPTEPGYGLAGGGGIGPYMYCPSCGAITNKQTDPTS